MAEQLTNKNKRKKYKKSGSESGSGTEKVWLFGRNINAIGAIAIAAVAAVIPGPNVVLAGWAGINAAQAGGFEVLRQRSKKKYKSKKSSKKNT